MKDPKLVLNQPPTNTLKKQEKIDPPEEVIFRSILKDPYDLGLWRRACLLLDSSNEKYSIPVPILGMRVKVIGGEQKTLMGRLFLRAGLREEGHSCLRRAPFEASHRWLSIDLTRRNASVDLEFRDLIAEAGKNMEQGAFGQAEFHYYTALRLYPLHPEVTFLYALAICEQGKAVDGEVFLRSAANLGYDLEAVRTKLAAYRMPSQVPKLSALKAVIGLDAPPTAEDIVSSFRIFMRRDALKTDVLDHIREHRSMKYFLLDILKSDEFRQKNVGALSLYAKKTESQRNV
jgi:hypothetical protein